MLNLRRAKRFAVVGGGTAGWFAALFLRKLLGKHIEVCVIESSDIGIVGVGEGGIPNIISCLLKLDIDIKEVMQATQASYKWGFSYEGWRTGQPDDQYFHLFFNFQDPAFEKAHEFYPNLSQMLSSNIPMHYFSKGVDGILNNVSQAEAFEMMRQPDLGIVSSIHFDSYRIAKFLKSKAIERGIVCRDAVVTEVVQNEQGNVTQLVTKDDSIDVDFVIDASGLARLIINQMNPEWVSFSDSLLMDSAIPFYMPHPFKNPTLYSRAIAMNAGWMWQIPLQERVGAGYVFSSKHITPEQAQKEAEAYLGYAIDVQKVIRFKPGCHKEVWKGNVLALGLSSGFVEPLEATSIGQMLEQLQRFVQILMVSDMVIPQVAIDNFNEANLAAWTGIRDFLRMHYDCSRRDTPFWQDVAQLPLSETYRQLREVWQERTPRPTDFFSYQKHGWSGTFSAESWLFVGAGVGAVPSKAAHNELQCLPPDRQKKASDFADQCQIRRKK